MSQTLTSRNESPTWDHSRHPYYEDLQPANRARDQREYQAELCIDSFETAIIKFIVFGGDDIKFWGEAFDLKHQRFFNDLKKQSPPKEIVLEKLQGFVDKIDFETAYVTFTTEDGEELLGEYPANELKEKGIRENRRFFCKTVEVNGKIHVRVEAIPDIEVLSDEQETIKSRIEKLLEGGDFDGDF